MEFKFKKKIPKIFVKLLKSTEIYCGYRLRGNWGCISLLKWSSVYMHCLSFRQYTSIDHFQIFLVFCSHAITLFTISEHLSNIPVILARFFLLNKVYGVKLLSTTCGHTTNVTLGQEKLLDVSVLDNTLEFC